MEGQAGKVIASIKVDGGHFSVTISIFDSKQRTDLVLILSRFAVFYIRA